MLLIARVISALSTVAVLAVVARAGDAAQLGLVAVGLTVGLVLAVVSEAGLSTLLIREVARQPRNSGALLTAVLLTRVVALPTALLVAAVLLQASRPEDAGTILIVALGPAVQQVGELARSVFIARKRVFMASIHSIVENACWMFTIGVGYVMGLSLSATFSAAAAVLIVVEVGAFILLGMVLRIRLELPSRMLARRLVRLAGPFVAFATLMIVASRADTLLIFALLPNSLPLVGAYFAAARLLAAGEYVPEVIGRAILPELSRRHQSAPTTVVEVMAPAARQTLAIGILIPFGVILTGAWVFGILYGPEMVSNGWLLVAMAGVLPFRFMSMLFGVALASLDAQVWRTVAVGLAVAVSFAMEVVLIPRLGAVGAIAGMYGVWTITAVLSVVGTRRIMGPVLRWRDVFLPLAVGGMAFAVGALVLVSGVVGAPPLAGTTYAAIVGAGLVGLVTRSKRRAAALAGSGRPE